ncbi:MAG: hypothetical protein HQ506_09020 [Candidatus Marinimicrobia bacterium]|nr:hypothetical protein [Candidatus Neomarinimicrobiota bacterium]
MTVFPLVQRCLGRVSLLLLSSTFLQAADSYVPEHYPQRLHSYSEVTQLLTGLCDDPYFSVEQSGESTEGRALWLLKIAHPDQVIKTRMFFYAQQHGNEPAGKEALLHIAKAIRDDHKILPKGTALWFMPMVNPDGAEKDQRRNGAGADLNRDHMTLEQPETQALHRAFRSIRPQVSIDCHEFGRDSQDYVSEGWIEWPEIMMDYANYPLLGDKIVAQGASLVERMEPAMLKKGIKFHRYFVGGVPPDGEQRFSAPDMDGGLNGAGIYGGLSFIIEVGVYRNSNEDNHDLPRRVYNYTELLLEVLNDKILRKQAMTSLETTTTPKTPLWVPTNYFWARLDESVVDLPVIDAATKEAKMIAAPNFMTDLVIKKRVAVPEAYLVPPEYATIFEQLLSAHAIPFQVLGNTTDLTVEHCLLDTVEAEFDELYHRYGGRVITTRTSPQRVQAPKGSLLIPIEPIHANRVLALLEPLQMYGLYQYPTYRKLVDESRRIPVSRLISSSP